MDSQHLPYQCRILAHKIRSLISPVLFLYDDGIADSCKSTKHTVPVGSSIKAVLTKILHIPYSRHRTTV